MCLGRPQLLNVTVAHLPYHADLHRFTGIALQASVRPSHILQMRLVKCLYRSGFLPVKAQPQQFTSYSDSSDTADCSGFSCGPLVLRSSSLLSLTRPRLRAPSFSEVVSLANPPPTLRLTSVRHSPPTLNSSSAYSLRGICL